VTGTVYNSTGGPAADRRVTFQLLQSQAPPGNCVVRASVHTYMTDANGVLPDDCTAVADTQTLITVENGNAWVASIPLTSPVDINNLALNTSGTATPTRTRTPTP